MRIDEIDQMKNSQSIKMNSMIAPSKLNLSRPTKNNQLSHTASDKHSIKASCKITCNSLFQEPTTAYPIRLVYVLSDQNKHNITDNLLIKYSINLKIHASDQYEDVSPTSLNFIMTDQIPSIFTKNLVQIHTPPSEYTNTFNSMTLL